MSYYFYDMSQSTAPEDLTPKHIRAARALLAWSQQDLAKKAGVATSTVADFERGQRKPVANNALAIRNALETAGIHFLPTGAVHGPAIPVITPSKAAATPIRWVDAQDLSEWADRTDGAVSLPTLISHLIRATHGSAIELRFPSDEGVRHPGWDGYTSTDTGSMYVPEGEAGWEIGSQRSKIAQKATEDYEKRTAKPDPVDPANGTYVFVTPRHWPKKHEWLKARRTEGVWKDVRAYDADDLVHWIELTPAIGLWLATRIGKRPAGARQLTEIWEEWSLATKWPLTEELILSDRDEDSKAVLQWLRAEPSVLSLQSTTAEEVMAFFHATLGMLPDEVAANYRVLTLVITSADAARDLVNAPGPLIIVLSEPEPGLARSLAQRGHYVLQVYDDRPLSRGEVRRLKRPSRENIAAALESAGISRPRAEALARDSARNLAILRRLIPAAPGRDPAWAQHPPSRALVAALLVGGWDEDSEGDIFQFSELAGQAYKDAITALAPFVGELDRPLQKIGRTWRVASPLDAWFYLAPYLTDADIDRFEAAAQAVLGSADPRFEMEPDERWMASVKGVHREYSGLMRHGIGEVLILLALWGDRAHVMGETSRRADGIVATLLRNADRQRWWSLSRDFRLLAEASPNHFLTAIEDSLDQVDPPIRSLFGADDDGMFGTEHLSDLLWALESLAWSPELMPRVSHVLARLDGIDTPQGRHSNRPANSLREIHLLWIPQTFATLAQRLKAIDLIRKREPEAAWKLMLGILPKGHDTSTPSPMPQWRDFSVDRVETVTYGLIGRGAAAITDRLLEDVGTRPERWVQILDRFPDLAPDPKEGLAALDRADAEISDADGRASIWKRLRHVLHHHRQFPDAEWSMPSETLDQLEAIYHRFAPADALERVAWLFDQNVELPNPSKLGWKGEQREVDAIRVRAATEIYAESASAGILALARLVEAPGFIGKALYDGGVREERMDKLIESSLRSGNSSERGVGHGMIVSAVRDLGESWATSLFAKAQAEIWGDDALLAVLRAFPDHRWTWKLARVAGEEIEAAYWRQIPVFWMSDDDEDVGYAIRKLIEAGRARHAVSLAGRDGKAKLTSELLVELLRESVRQPLEDSSGNDATMFQHYVEEILEVLDGRGDVDEKELVSLEWSYLPLLAHSRRPPRVLMKALSREPELFVEMLKAAYKSSEEVEVPAEETKEPERAKAIAHQAWRLLDMWNRIPGTKEDGSIDAEELANWIKQARLLAKAVGREEVADSRIGNMLSASPIGSDGNWPAEPVRHAIDLFRSKPMISGFWVGKSNRRGVTSRAPRDGGRLERDEAQCYRDWAKEIAFEHPYTANALNTLAESYEVQASQHDESAERLDWR